MYRIAWIALALVLVSCDAVPAFAACEARIGKACNVQVPCCAVALDNVTPLTCTKGSGSATCQPGTPPTTTPTTTPTTVPSTPTTSTPGTTALPISPPTTAVGPVIVARFSSYQVGNAYTDSQWIGWDNRVVPARPANQYVQNVRALSRLWQYFPGVLRAIRDTVGWSYNQSQAVNDVVGKFYILYSLRPCRAGGPYPYRANYLWDLPKSISNGAASQMVNDPWVASSPSITPDVLGWFNFVRAGSVLVRGPKPNLTRVGSIDERPGTPCAKPRIRPPLTLHQRNLVQAAMDVHDRQAHEVIAYARSNFVDTQARERAEALSGQVKAAHIALTGSARTYDEATLFEAVFTGDIDRLHSPAIVLAHTQALLAWHHEWGAELLDPTGPDAVLVWEFLMGHNREHFLRAVWLPGLALREVCAGDIHYCPVTNAAAMPARS